MQNHYKSIYKNAFTLVELIVVIVIMAILATIAFLSFWSYSSNSRDSTRISDVSQISKWLMLDATQFSFMAFPDDYIKINSWSTTLGYQWYAWDKVLRKIKYLNWWKDPLDGSYYLYSTNTTRNKYQVMAFLESRESVVDFYSVSQEAFSQDYVWRFPYVRWDAMWILLYLSWSTYTPIQSIASISWSWFIDISSTWSQNFIAVSNNTTSNSLSSSWTVWSIINWFDSKIVQTSTSTWITIDPNALTLSWTDVTWRTWSNLSYAKSCNEYRKPWSWYAYYWNTWDWVYWIDIDWTWWVAPYKVFCDMTSDWGWWTAYYAGKNGSTNYFNSFVTTALDCTDVLNKCLRRLPSNADIWYDYAASLGDSMIKFKFESTWVDYFKNWTINSWQNIPSAISIKWTVSKLPNFLFTSVQNPYYWFIFWDRATYSWTYLSTYVQDPLYNVWNWLADTTSIIRLFYRENTIWTIQDNSALSVMNTCLDHKNAWRTSDWIYMIDPDWGAWNPPFKAICDMTTNWWWWTLAIKFKSLNSVLSFDSPYWTSSIDSTLNDTDLSLSDADAKYASFSTLIWTELRFSMANWSEKNSYKTYAWTVKSFSQLSLPQQWWYTHWQNVITNPHAPTELILNWIWYWWNYYYNTTTNSRIWVVLDDIYQWCSWSDFAIWYWLKNTRCDWNAWISCWAWWAWMVNSWWKEYRRWSIWIR